MTFSRLTIVIGGLACAMTLAGATRAAAQAGALSPPAASGTALLSTDRGNYSVGDTVAISGRGWTRGETVRITFIEDPMEHAPVVLDLVADAVGEIHSRQFVIAPTDTNVTFTLNARGSISRLTATTSFTDADPFYGYEMSIVGPNPVPAGRQIRIAVEVKRWAWSLKEIGFRIHAIVPTGWSYSFSTGDLLNFAWGQFHYTTYLYVNVPCNAGSDGWFRVYGHFTDSGDNYSDYNYFDVTPDGAAPAPNYSPLPTRYGTCSYYLSDNWTASDACMGTVYGTPSQRSFSGPGTYSVRWTYSDYRGNTSSQYQTVVVTDYVAPVMTAPPSFTVTTAAGATTCSKRVDDSMLGSPSIYDNCGTYYWDRIGIPSDRMYPVGNTTITYRAWDAGGNLTQRTQVVTVLDRTPPLVYVPPPLDVATGPGATGCTVFISDAQLGVGRADDVCTGGASVVRGAVPWGNMFQAGTTNVGYTGTDASGNSITQVQTVRVRDTTPPVITCPANISRPADAGGTSAIVTYAPTATDNCTQNPQMSVTPPSGSVFHMGTTHVSCVATDAAGNTANCGFDVTITNPPPLVTILSPASGSMILAGTTVAFFGEYTDNTGDTHTAQWTIGGVSVPGAVDEATDQVTGSYTFPTAGVYLVKLTVTDQAGGAGVATMVGEFEAMVVVFDISGSIAVGGGWFQSPPGAMASGPILAGKANFGFFTQLKKSATVPNGSVEFRFRAGDLSFSSATLDELTVLGAKSICRGTGSLGGGGGGGGYSFLLSAIDGSVEVPAGTDRMRMKIWRTATTELVYDNQPGALDDADPVTVLGGGSLLVHEIGTLLAGALPGSGERTPGGLRGPVPAAFALHQNHPNPFRAGTAIHFDLPERAAVKLVVYDVAGRMVTTLVDESREPGSHTVNWQGRDAGGAAVGAGVCFYRFEARGEGGQVFRALRKMIVLK